MSAGFWIKRFLISLLGAGVLLFGVELAKGHAQAAAAKFAIIWGLVFAVLFTGIGYIRFKRNPACMRPASRDK
ncbi:MAG: hypothetical protein ACK4R2_04825 [Roseateles sp.]|jgi:hypothetical protein